MSWASATSVGAISGVVSAARPISAKVLVVKVLVTVNGPAGASSSPSCASRAASVVGSSVARAVGAVADSGRTVTSLAASVSISVVPANSFTGPVTSTWSPTFTAAVAAEP